MQKTMEDWQTEMKKYVQEINDHKGIMKTLSDTVRQQSEEFDSGMQKLMDKQEVFTMTYADKAKVKKHEPVLIIKPKDEGQKSMITKEEIRKNIDPTTIEIAGVKHASRGGIIIECKNKEAISQLKSEAERTLGEKYNINIPKQRKPRVKIVGMMERRDLGEVEEKIKAQNHFLTDKAEIKVVYVAPTKNRRFSNYFAYVEVDSESYRKLLEEQRINIGWDRCKVYDAVTVTRCYNCNSFNHRAKECTKETVCPKCAGSHSRAECKASKDEVKCINCKNAVEKLKLKIDINHEAWDVECSVFKRKLAVEKNKVDFLE